MKMRSEEIFQSEDDWGDKVNTEMIVLRPCPPHIEDRYQIEEVQTENLLYVFVVLQTVSQHTFMI